MGGTNSKIYKYLESGDEESSLKLIEENSDLLKNFNANEILNDLCETPLLLSFKWSMPSLVKTFLYDCNGNPNQRNVFNQSALHLICQIPVRYSDDSDDGTEPQNCCSEMTEQKRIECLNLILEWNRVCLDNKSKRVMESIDLNGLDRNGNTALHLAATNGLFECVKILVTNGSDLSTENELGDTASELAEKYNHFDILRYLEFKIVFSDQSNAVLVNNSNYCLEEEYSSLMSQDLDGVKNQLIVETSNMLNISLSSAEVLLRSFDWSQESLIEQWINDSDNNTKPKYLTSFNTNEIIESENQIQDINGQQSTQSPKDFCEICSLELESLGATSAKCGHQFCLKCWRTYLELKIDNGETAAITCPAFNCSQFVTKEIIEKVVSPEIMDRFMRNDIKVFIENNTCVQWCPNPSCDKAVVLHESKIAVKDEESYVLANLPPLLPVSRAVDCGSGHYFCWQCKSEAHSPCDCKLWNDWMTKISDIKNDELKQTYSRTEDAANSLWLVRNAKQCPHCKTHIQKTEGCNHLRCSKCKYDFCWICLESWKKHNSSTGGYFRCNRSVAAQRAEQNICLLKRVAEQQNCEMKELKKFVFHYTKYKLNNLSKESETTLLEHSKSKQKELFDYSLQILPENSSERVEESDDFLSEATLEVIRSRKILCGSAVYGYYLEDYGYNKAIFEYMENNLNDSCNRLSDIIGFHYIKNSKNYIINLTNKLKTKRLELLSAVSKGLIPPETPPGLNKHYRRQCLPGVLALDSIENISNPCDDNDNNLIDDAIISSLSDLKDNNSWIQDRSGKHNNLFVIYDWPDDCDVDYYTNPNNDKKFGENSKSDETDVEVCMNPKCNRPKMKNPRTGEKHNFCSLKCKHLSEDTNSFEDKLQFSHEYDSSMDVLLAIEMSKISYKEEMDRQSDSVSVAFNETTDEINEKTIENPFEMFVENIKSNPNVSQSSAKNAIMFFLKSSFNEMVDQKNFNHSSNDMKVDKNALFFG